MPKIPRSRAVAFVADVASLPTSGADGALRIALDDGTGVPALFIWDSGSSSWVICVGGSGTAALREVLDKDLNTPPGAPSAGDTYIVAAGGVGAWAGHDADIAEWDGASWDFTTPVEGYAVWVVDEDFIYVFDGASWIRLSTRIDHGLLLGLGDDDHTQYHNDARGDARYYTQTDLDAAPVAAGAKVDKIVGTDHAIVRSAGVAGAVQDSPKSTIADNGQVSFDTPARVADAPILLVSNDGSNLFLVATGTGEGGIAILKGDSTDKGANLRVETFDATGKAIVIVGLAGTGGITTTADLGASVAEIENTLAAPFVIRNTGGPLRFEVTTPGGDDFQFDLPSNDGSDKVAVRDSDDAEVATIDSDGNIDGNNVTSTNISAAETQPGTSEIATQAEVTTGTDDLRIVTPLKLATGVYTKSEVDILVDATMKAPEAYDPTITGNYPITYGGSAVEAGDSFRITVAGTMGGITVNIEDLLIALVDAPAQVDANWMVAESNRDQATETVKGVAELATQAEVDAETDDLRIVTPLKLNKKVSGPASATDNAIARFDLATGKVIQNSGGSIDDSGNITGNNLSGTNSGDEVQATEAVAGIGEVATQAETDAGTDDARFVTPLKLRATPDFRNYNAQVATPYTAAASDDTITMNVAGASAVNLPTVIGITGKVYTTVRLSPAGPNAVTVTPNGIETIGGAASFVMNAFQQSITFQSDGVSNWILI